VRKGLKPPFEKERIMRMWLPIVLLAGSVFAQERPEARDDEEKGRQQIRVLENPYDIASFYRSSQGFGFNPPMAAERYPIASYYRSHQTSAYGFAPFWNRGYSSRGPVLGYRRSIGQNGDLFLFAPTFLAPVGPLSGEFSSW
jgi:hypothetical protein